MRLKCLAVAAVLAFAAFGCGDSDSDSDKSAAKGKTVPTQPSSQQPDPASTDTSDRGVIQEVVDDLQDSLFIGSGWGPCTETTAAQTARLTKSARQGEDCTTAISRKLAGYKRDGVERVRTKVASVDVGRDRAIASVRDDDGATYEVVLVLDGGTWKLPKVDLARPSGLVPR